MHTLERPMAMPPLGSSHGTIEMKNNKLHIRHRRRAIIITEVVIAVALAALMAALAGKGISDYVKASRADRAQRAVTWAADAQLQRYQAGAANDSQPPADLFADDIRLLNTKTDGQGQWSEFLCVTVTAQTEIQGRTVQAQVRGYLPKEGRP